MKKIIAIVMCLFVLSGCGQTRKPELSFTEGRVLEKGESKGMLGVEGKITKLDNDEISVNVAGQIYEFKLTEKFNRQLENFRKNKHKIDVGTYVQIFYNEEIVQSSKEYKDVNSKEKIADSFSIVYEN